jgi:hypothetical protein
MSGKKRAGSAFIVALLILAGALVPATATAAPKKVFWVDLFFQLEQKPDFIAFTANSGPRMQNIRWKNWGGSKAVGRGYYRDTQPNPIAAKRKGPARMIARKPIRCTIKFGEQTGRKVWVYRYVKLIHPNGNGGMRGVDVSAYGGYQACR